MEEKHWIILATFVLGLALIAVSYYFGYHNGRYGRKHKKSKEPEPKSYWNNRIATRLLKHPLREGFWREYLVIECHYTDGKPRAYGERVRMDGYEEVDDIKSTSERIINAFDKPIIDLDNFPNEYKL